ncbi:nucleoside-diphosphate sugar epimerase/dehydratase [Sphingomonas sp. BK580]|uniref:polysaccharide biosynthesis protein n=1 Tax=Sphingomonas sp. BK580 TaxID=2586972 RepID=UPI001620F162|nr:nucleoside-diphosphate sugar epimerase/dehydratase [Sphingomonas sp. BK580]MBB3693788.1 FlaA1/EpsC-like NDP-sugar epimerase [Sphingomonas sp. BK580]
MSSFAVPLLALPRASKRVMAATIDAALCALTIWIAYYLRLGYFISLAGRPSVAVGLSVALALPAFHIAGLYNMAFRRAGAEMIPTAGVACAAYGLCYVIIISGYAFDNVPRTIGIVQPILLFLAVCSVRLAVGYVLGGQMQRRLDLKPLHRVLIYGAGSSGRQLAAAIGASRESNVVGFIDDDRSISGTRINGLPVYQSDDLAALIEDRRIDDILLALPSASRQRRNEIIHNLRGLPVGVRTLPGLMDLAHGRVEASDLRELTIEDLLSRDPVAPDTTMVSEKIASKTVLVTGAGGSIGSELCRQILLAQPARLLMLEQSEFALYAIHGQLTEVSKVAIVPLLGSVTDPIRVAQVMAAWEPEIVFHAAAYKHVPLVEHNPLEGMRNNVIGTRCVAELAVAHGVQDFVLVSTDKAVRPTNIMGATKRLAELILQALASESTGTRFSMVRFGNVLGSSGSVVPLFREQIRRGGPITITHRDITRYFMTIPEAAQLVVQASAMATGGEVFVLDMGEPVRIMDLARNMVELCGLTVKSATNPGGDIEIVTVGLRPGEKLFEELLIGNNPRPTRHPRIMMASEHHIPWLTLAPQLAELERLVNAGAVQATRVLLCQLVREFAPTSEIVDFVLLHTATKVVDAAPPKTEPTAALPRPRMRHGT